MERADSKWLAHVRDRNGIDGATRSVGVRSVRFARNRFVEMASPGASRGHRRASLRGASLEQIAIRSHRNSFIEVGTVEPERPPGLFNAGDDPVRRNETGGSLAGHRDQDCGMALTTSRA